MSSIRGTSVIGRVFFKIEKTFIRPIALSTCIRALAIFLLTITLSSDICSSPELGGGIFSLTTRSSFVVRPLSTIIKQGRSQGRVPGVLGGDMFSLKQSFTIK